MTLVMTVSVLALAGCGGGSKPAETQAPQTTEAVTEASTEAVTEAPTEAATEAQTEAVTESAIDAILDYTTIREYLEDPEVIPQIEQAEQNNSNDQITLEILAEGDNTLLYKCTFVENYSGGQAEALAASLEEALDEDMEENMLSVKQTIESASAIRGLKIRAAYYLPDGTLLAERIYGE